MFSQQGVIVDILQNLRRVECEGEINGIPVTMVRIFDPVTAEQKGITVEGYESLDAHPEVILYEGYYRDVGGQAQDIHIEAK